jgi:hypothetical protein
LAQDEPSEDRPEPSDWRGDCIGTASTRSHDDTLLLTSETGTGGEVDEAALAAASRFLFSLAFFF